MNPLRKNGKFIAYASPLDQLNAYTAVNLDTGCHEWTGTLDKDGYGKICVNHRTMRTHRLAYNLHHGVELQPSEQLNHKCHNRRCCNPEHVYIGTQAENMADREEHSGIPKGENHPNAVLTEETVAEVRRMCAEGFNQRRLALMLGVSKSTISSIATGRTWSHLNAQ